MLIKISQNDQGGRWHRGYDVKIEGSYGCIQFTGMETGCGLMQMHGFAYMFRMSPLDFKYINTVVKEIKEQIFEKYIHNDGVGAIVATLGDTYYTADNVLYFLEKLGFKQTVEYTNYRHGQNATQRIYILTL